MVSRDFLPFPCKIGIIFFKKCMSKPSEAREQYGEEADTSFSAELTDQRGNMTREELEALLKKIDEQGAKLTKTPTYDELRAYRSLVQEFVNEAVANMYELHTSAGWDRMGRQKVYTTVRSIVDLYS